MHSWLGSRIACVLLLLSSVLHVDGLQHNQHSDVAHRPRTGGHSLFPRLELDEALMVYYEKGARNLYMMRGRPCFPPGNLFGTKDLSDSGWSVSKVARAPELVLTIPEKLFSALEKLGLLTDWKEYQTFYVDYVGTGSPKNNERYHLTSGHFYNMFSPSFGVIISLDNVSPIMVPVNDGIALGETLGLPPLHRFSDVVPIAWSELVAERRNLHQEVMPLRYWLRLVPQGNSETRRVMQRISDKRRSPEGPPPPRGTEAGWTFKIRDSGQQGMWAKALIGTPHGSGVTMALATNSHHLDGYRIVDQVTMLRLDHKGGPNVEWALVFGITQLDETLVHGNPLDDDPPRENLLPGAQSHSEPDDYDTSVKNGQTNLEGMQGWPRFPPPNLYKPTDLIASGWNLSNTSPSARRSLVPQALGAVLLSLGVALESDQIQLFYADLKPAWKAYYYSAFNYAKGIIVTMETRSLEEARSTSQEITIPHVHQFSDVVPLVYYTWVTSEKQDPQDWPLKFWVFTEIRLPSLTADIILQVIRRRPGGPRANRSYPPAAPGWRFAVDDEQGKALLGTAQGQAVALSLAKNPNIFGKSRRIVSHVTLFRTSWRTQPWTAGLLFEIGELPSQHPGTTLPSQPHGDLLLQHIDLDDAAEKGQTLYNLMKGWPHFPETVSLTVADLIRDGWKIADWPSQRFGDAQGEAYLGPNWPGPFRSIFHHFDRTKFQVVFADQTETAVGSINSHYYNMICVLAGAIVSVSKVSPEDFKEAHPEVPTPHITRYSDIIGVIYSVQSRPIPENGSPNSPLKVWAFPVAPGSPAFLMMAAMVFELRENTQREVLPEYPGWHFQVRNDPLNREKYARALLTTPEGRDVVDALTRNEYHFGGRRIVDSVRIYGDPLVGDWYLVFYLDGLKATRKRPASQELPHRGSGEGPSRHGPYY